MCLLADDAAQLSEELAASQETTTSQTERIEALEEEKTILQSELDGLSKQYEQMEYAFKPSRIALNASSYYMQTEKFPVHSILHFPPDL